MTYIPFPLTKKYEVNLKNEVSKVTRTKQHPTQSLKILGWQLIYSHPDYNHVYFSVCPISGSRPFPPSCVKILPRKGNLSNLNKWKGIALLNLCWALISSILATICGNYFQVQIQKPVWWCNTKGCQNTIFSLTYAFKLFSRKNKRYTPSLPTLPKPTIR